MSRKVLDTEEVAQITKKETIRYFMRIIEEEPEEHDEFFDNILINDYFKIKIDLLRLLKLLKPLIKDKTTNIRILENEIFDSENLAFVDDTKGKEVAKDSGDLYIRTSFTPKHKEETQKNKITLYTNLFKVKLDPDNPVHLVFMKKMIDMRSSPILKHKQGNKNETDIKTFIEILKLTFNMKSKFDYDTIFNGGTAYNFRKMIKSEAPSLSREVSGASIVSTASSIRDEKSTFFMSVEKLKPKKYDFYGENINYFTYILLRETEQGLNVYNEWYSEFIDSYYFTNYYYVLWSNFKGMLDDYVFDSVLEDLLEALEEDDEEEPNYVRLSFQTFIPKKQREDIKKGNILFLTKEICLTFTVEEDIQFLEELPLIYPKEIYDKKVKIRDYTNFMKSLYLEEDDFGDSGIDSDISEDEGNKLSKIVLEMYYKYFDFIRANYEILVEEYPKTTSSKRIDIMNDEITQKLIKIYSLSSKQFKDYVKEEREEVENLTDTLIINIDENITNRQVLNMHSAYFYNSPNMY